MCAFARQINILRVPSEGRFREECFMLRVRSFVQTSVIKQDFRFGKRYTLFVLVYTCNFLLIVLVLQYSIYTPQFSNESMPN